MEVEFMLGGGGGRGWKCRGGGEGGGALRRGGPVAGTSAGAETEVLAGVRDAEGRPAVARGRQGAGREFWVLETEGGRGAAGRDVMAVGGPIG